MPKDLDPLMKESAVHKSLCEQIPERAPGSLRRQRERNCIPDLRKARDEWERTNRFDEPQGQDCTLTEEQMMLNAALVVCFDTKRHFWR